MLRLGDQHIPLLESLEVEFKEFCLNEIEIDNKKINEIVNSGKVSSKDIFDQDIYKNIKYYFYKYIPKYISSFINANINGELIFGVNDYGEITGIPFFGSKEELEKYIKEINIDKLVRYQGEKSYEITFEIKKLKIDINFLENTSDKMIVEYYKNVKKRNLIIKKYKNDHLKWINKMDKYTCKLSILLSTKRDEFKEFLTLHSPEHLNYKIKESEMKNINHLKIDPSHYIFWLMKFKDEILTKIKKLKPKMPDMTLVKIINGPSYMYKHLSNLRYKLVESNKDINYFIINIKINLLDDKNCSAILYYDIHKKIWIEKVRKLYNEIPMCESSSSENN